MSIRAIVFDRTCGAGPAQLFSPSEERKRVPLREPLDEAERLREAVKSALSYLSQPVPALEDALAVLTAAVRTEEPETGRLGRSCPRRKHDVGAWATTDRVR